MQKLPPLTPVAVVMSVVVIGEIIYSVTSPSKSSDSNTDVTPAPTQAIAAPIFQSENDLINRLPSGDTSTAQCNQYIQNENAHTDAVNVPSGPDKFIENINAHKYLYTKKLCLAWISRIQIYPGDTIETQDSFIVDLAAPDYIISEISSKGFQDTKIWYFDKPIIPVTEKTKGPGDIWAEIQNIQ